MTSSQHKNVIRTLIIITKSGELHWLSFSFRGMFCKQLCCVLKQISRTIFHLWWAFQSRVCLSLYSCVIGRSYRSNTTKILSSKQIQLRWDKYDRVSYYSCTWLELEPILTNVDSTLWPMNCEILPLQPFLSVLNWVILGLLLSPFCRQQQLIKDARSAWRPCYILPMFYLFFYGRLILRPWLTNVRETFTRAGPWASIEKLLLGFFPGHP